MNNRETSSSDHNQSTLETTSTPESHSIESKSSSGSRTSSVYNLEHLAHLPPDKRQRAIVQMQRQYGNAAVRRMLDNTSAPSNSIQRSGDSGGKSGSDSITTTLPIFVAAQKEISGQYFDTEFTGIVTGTAVLKAAGFDMLPGEQDIGVKVPGGGSTASSGSDGTSLKNAAQAEATTKLYELYNAETTQEKTDQNMNKSVYEKIELEEAYVELGAGGAREDTYNANGRGTSNKGEIGVFLVVKGNIAGRPIEGKIGVKIEKEIGAGTGGALQISLKVPLTTDEQTSTYKSLTLTLQLQADFTGQVAFKVTAKHLPAIASKVASAMEGFAVILTSPAMFIAGGAVTIGAAAANIIAAGALEEMPDRASKLATEYANGFVAGVVNGNGGGFSPVAIAGASAGRQLYQAAMATPDWNEAAYLVEAGNLRSQHWQEAYSTFYSTAYDMASARFSELYGDSNLLEYQKEAAQQTAESNDPDRYGSAAWAYDKAHPEGEPQQYSQEEIEQAIKDREVLDMLEMGLWPPGMSEEEVDAVLERQAASIGSD